MFSENELNQFITKMFENATKDRSINNNLSEGLKSFHKYLAETHMCTSEYLDKLNKIILCTDELLALKLKIKTLDVISIIDSELTAQEQKNNETANNKLPKQKKIGTIPSYNSDGNHCQSYIEDLYSNSCGGGSSKYRRC